MEDEIVEEEKLIQHFKVDLINKRHQVGSLIPLLQSAQDSYGYIPEKIIYYISELVNIPPADIYGVITFFAQFRLKPAGKNLIRICEGTACHVNGAKTVLSVLQDELGISKDETTDDGNFTLVSVACLGCCSLAPIMMINDETFGNLNADKIKKALKKFYIEEKLLVET
ncbi:MAG: NADH-quinone oxidoreductase subunit NuoE [Bacteroidetes bacterium]|nr:NADH-quinone oxidoreductase subunit NuoE [Bacteroidota bacterium]